MKYYYTTTILINLYNILNPVLLIYSALHGERHSFNSLGKGFVFPSPGISLSDFSIDEIPQIHFPFHFLLAVRGIEIPTGKGPR